MTIINIHSGGALTRSQISENSGPLRTINFRAIDGFKGHFRMTLKTFELLSNFLALSEHIHLVGRPLNKENK